MRIFLVRHGITEFNQKRRIQGQKDVPLSPEGRKQAQETGIYLQCIGLKKTFTSDLSRARETAEIISNPLGLVPEVVPDLREIDMGNWEGFSWEEVGANYPQEQKAWMEDPLNNGPEGGENLKQATYRFKKAFLALTDPEENESPLLVVSHGLVIGTFVAWLKGKSPVCWKEYSPENASITEISRKNKEIELVSFNKQI